LSENTGSWQACAFADRGLQIFWSTAFSQSICSYEHESISAAYLGTNIAQVVAIATGIKIIVFICIDEKTAGRCAPVSSKILYCDGLHFADAKDREQSLPPTAVVGFKSAGAAKDRSLAANIDADRALISFKEMPITHVEANHNALKVARGEIGGLAVEAATLINDFEGRQNPALLDIVEFDGFIWDPDRNRRH
jgi:hypothetical protein